MERCWKGLGNQLHRQFCGMPDPGADFAGAGASGTADYFAGFINGKLSIPAGQMFFRAVLCNFFVCLAVLCGIKLKSESGKFLMIVICISGFVVSGLSIVLQIWVFLQLHSVWCQDCLSALCLKHGDRNTGKYSWRSCASGMAA